MGTSHAPQPNSHDAAPKRPFGRLPPALNPPININSAARMNTTASTYPTTGDGAFATGSAAFFFVCFFFFAIMLLIILAIDVLV